jgi:hypothetical protein
MRKTANQ